MSQLQLHDLSNPRQITEVFHLRQQHYVVPGTDQAFQEYPGSVELWQRLEDGRIMRVQRWLKKSIIVYTKSNQVGASTP